MEKVKKVKGANRFQNAEKIIDNAQEHLLDDVLLLSRKERTARFEFIRTCIEIAELHAIDVEPSWQDE